ncbi:hypothetical protein Dimus_017061 [Dionaea muscipula]
MGFKKALAHRLLNISMLTNPSPSRNLARPPLTQCLMRSDPGDSTLFGGVMQWRPLYQSAVTPTIRLLPTGDSLLERLREMDIVRDRVRLEGLTTPPTKGLEGSLSEIGLTMEDLEKLMIVSQVEMVKAKLRETKNDWISYSEFVEICGRSCGGNKEEGMVYATMLNESGAVIVLGDSVCLRPGQVVKAIQNLNPFLLSNPNDPRKKELEELEQQKEEIDQKAESLARRELWCGLGYLFIQTVAFMRLTFWELSWDVMEPICFYVTSVYFMAGYAFFLRTSREPSFEGFFQSRFDSKQKSLFKTHNFDNQRYNELRRAIYPEDKEEVASSSSSLGSSRRMRFDRASHLPTIRLLRAHESKKFC